jgi:hypothetical protein
MDTEKCRDSKNNKRNRSFVNGDFRYLQFEFISVTLKKSTEKTGPLLTLPVIFFEPYLRCWVIIRHQDQMSRNNNLFRWDWIPKSNLT